MSLGKISPPDNKGAGYVQTTVGQIEKATQARVLALFQHRLGYHYLGNWIDRDNSNIDTSPCCGPG